MSAGREAVEALVRGNERVFGDLQRQRSRRLFDGRVSSKLAERLVAAGVDSPERLLFMFRAEVAKLPGVGKAGLEEVAVYRARYLPADL